MSADAFDVPETPIPRDRWGRPLVTPPDGGKPVPYTRTTTFVDALDSKFALMQWAERMVAIGLTEREDLLLAVSAHRQDKKKLNGICEEAKQAARSSAAATTGTALHALTERIDRGLELPALPERARRDLHAYEQATAALEPVLIEQFCVLDELQIGGTPDRIVRYEGEYYVADVKGLALDTPIPVPDGWTTMRDVQVGDKVFGSNGKPCTVTVKSGVKRIGTFVVRFDDGASVVCDSEHLWWVLSGRQRLGEHRPQVRPITEISETLHSYGQAHHRVPVAEPLDLPHADLGIDPYVLGCWLGDGAVRGGTISKARDLFTVLESDGHELGVEQVDKRSGCVTRTVVGLTAQLRAADLLHHKRIPGEYLRASLRQRQRLLQGLMDTDGTWNTARRTAVFNSTDKELALAAEELLLTLGQRPHFASVDTHGYGKDITAYSVEFTPVGFNPFRLPRKADQAAASSKPTTHAQRRVIVAVEEGPDVSTACIGVDSSNHTYLCGSRMVPTHNTGGIDFGAMKIAQQLAVYSRATPYNYTTGERSPHEFEVDKQRAIVIHLPAGEGRCELRWIDIERGWDAVQVSGSVRQYRAVKDWYEPFGAPVVAEEPSAPALPSQIAAASSVTAQSLASQIAAASTVDGLRDLHAQAVLAGLDTESLLAQCMARKAEIEGAA